MMLVIQKEGKMAITLHQFEFSHFNEKARWALDFKGVVHTRTSYLPGPHMPAIKKLSAQTQTPVLQNQENYIAGSADIIAYLEEIHSEPSLYPRDAESRTRALTLQSEMDEQLGPAVRTVIFSGLINEPGYLVNMFGRSKSVVKRQLYRATFPLAKRLIAKGNGVDDQGNIDRCFKEVHAWLDQLQAILAGSEHLVGSEFSIADLTAASLLAPIANVSHTDMQRPQPMPATVQRILEQFSEHPTIHWVQRIYKNHRG